MNKPTIITFSGKARAGKTSAANILEKMLEDQGCRVLIISYADRLKDITRRYYGWDGNKDEYGRALLQRTGTEKIRAANPDFWVDSVVEFVKVVQDDYDYVLIPDARFCNEITRWHEEGFKFYTVYVERLNYISELSKEQQLHTSENDLREFIMFDTSLKAETIGELKEEVTNKLAQKFLPESQSELIRWINTYIKYPQGGKSYLIKSQSGEISVIHTNKNDDIKKYFDKEHVKYWAEMIKGPQFQS